MSDNERRMKSDLSERLTNKGEQYWWSPRRYASRVTSLFGWSTGVLQSVVAMWRRLEPGTATFVAFALPAATALIPLFVVTFGLVIVCFAVASVSTVVLLIWSALSDLVHVVLIAAYRLWQELARMILKWNVYVCPHCHTDLWRTAHKLPAYACDGVSHPAALQRRHYFLWPSTAGVFSHRCVCGARLSAVRRNGNAASRDALVAYCPKCGERERRHIGVREFGRLPHLGVALLAARSADGNGGGTRFMKTAWEGLTSGNGSGAGLGVKYADESSADEFANLLAARDRPNQRGRRQVGTWVWRVSGEGRKSLLYLYDSDLPADDDPGKSAFLEQTSGVVLVVSAAKGAREAASLAGRARRRLLPRVGAAHGKLRVPVAVVVEDCPADATPKTALATTGDGNSLIVFAENSFESIGYFAGDPRDSAAAVQWIVKQAGRVAGA